MPKKTIPLTAEAKQQQEKLRLHQAANVSLPTQQREEIENLDRNEEDMITQTANDSAYQLWNEEETTLLDKHVLYHKKMIEAIKQARTTGPLKKLPSPPKRKLKDLFNDKMGKKKKTEMTSEEFHKYLQLQLQDMRNPISREKFQFYNPENIEVAVKQLKDAYNHLSRQNAQTMYFNITFGNYLNMLYDWFLNRKKAEGVSVKWDVWLTNHISISSSHARKLRQIATLLINFPRFQHVSISLNEVLNKQSLIKKMLSINEYATFWKMV